jgi:hypothetical protein
MSLLTDHHAEFCLASSMIYFWELIQLQDDTFQLQKLLFVLAWQEFGCKLSAAILVS